MFTTSGGLWYNLYTTEYTTNHPPVWIKKVQNILSIKIENIHEILSHRIKFLEIVSFILDQIRV
jgi:hypothetical protein